MLDPELKEMAQKAGAGFGQVVRHGHEPEPIATFSDKSLAEFAALVAERCAKICQDRAEAIRVTHEKRGGLHGPIGADWVQGCADSIHALMGEKGSDMTSPTPWPGAVVGRGTSESAYERRALAEPTAQEKKT